MFQVMTTLAASFGLFCTGYLIGRSSVPRRGEFDPKSYRQGKADGYRMGRDDAEVERRLAG